MKKLIALIILMMASGCSDIKILSGEITTKPLSLDPVDKQSLTCRSKINWINSGIPILLKDQDGVIIGQTSLSSGQWAKTTLTELTDVEINAAKREGVDPTNVWARCKFSFSFNKVPKSEFYQVDINYIEPYVIPYNQVKDSGFYLELNID